MKVEDNDVSHDNDNSSLDNDYNIEVSNDNMYSLLAHLIIHFDILM